MSHSNCVAPYVWVSEKFRKLSTAGVIKRPKDSDSRDMGQDVIVPRPKDKGILLTGQTIVVLAFSFDSHKHTLAPAMAQASYAICMNSTSNNES